MSAQVPEPSSKAVAYGLILDTTAAMRGSLEEVIKIGHAFVAGNEAADETFIISYSKRDDTTLEQVFTTKKISLGHALDNLYSRGGKADLLDAIHLSIDEVIAPAGAPARKCALVLITGGANEDSFYTVTQVLALAREKKVAIHVIGLPQASSPEPPALETARKLCRQLADGSGGQVVFPGSQDEAVRIAGEILAVIRRSEPNPPTPGH